MGLLGVGACTPQSYPPSRLQLRPLKKRGRNVARSILMGSPLPQYDCQARHMPGNEISVIAAQCAPQRPSVPCLAQNWSTRRRH